MFLYKTGKSLGLTLLERVFKERALGFWKSQMTESHNREGDVREGSYEFPGHVLLTSHRLTLKEKVKIKPENLFYCNDTFLPLRTESRLAFIPTENAKRLQGLQVFTKHIYIYLYKSLEKLRNTLYLPSLKQIIMILNQSVWVSLIGC